MVSSRWSKSRLEPPRVPASGRGAHHGGPWVEGVAGQAALWGWGSGGPVRIPPTSPAPAGKERTGTSYQPLRCANGHWRQSRESRSGHQRVFGNDRFDVVRRRPSYRESMIVLRMQHCPDRGSDLNFIATARRTAGERKGLHALRCPFAPTPDAEKLISDQIRETGDAVTSQCWKVEVSG